MCVNVQRKVKPFHMLIAMHDIAASIVSPPERNAISLQASYIQSDDSPVPNNTKRLALLEHSSLDLVIIYQKDSTRPLKSPKEIPAKAVFVVPLLSVPQARDDTLQSRQYSLPSDTRHLLQVAHYPTA